MNSMQCAPHLLQGKTRFFAVIEPVDCATNLGWTQVELVHDESRRADFVLTDPSVDFGEVAHAHEQRTHVIVGHMTNSGIVAGAPLREETPIELVSKEESGGNRYELQCRGHEQDADNGADERADDFAPVQTHS
jgi:hypothetical protein